MSNSWAAIVRPTEVIFCPLDANSNDGNRIPEMLQLLGPQWAEYVSYHPEITMGGWFQERQISISWPAENEETFQKLKRCLESAGIVRQEILEEGEYLSVRKTSKAAAILDHAGIALTDPGCNFFAENKEHAKGICSGILHLRNACIPLTKEIVKFLCTNKKMGEDAAHLLVLMKRAGIGLTAGNLQLLNQNNDLNDLYTAIRNLEDAGIPLTRSIFLFMALPKKHGAAIGNAILHLHKANIPLTQDIRVFLGENIEHVEKLSFLIARIHGAGIPLTQGIFGFLERACKSQGKMKAEALADLQAAGIPGLQLSCGSEQMHAEALFRVVAEFHPQGELPPDEAANFFAAYESAISKLVSKRLHKAKIPLTFPIRRFFLLDWKCVEGISRSFLSLHQSGVPLTEPNNAFLLKCFLMRALGVCEVIEHLDRKKIDLTPEIRTLLISTIRFGVFGLLDQMNEKEIPLTEETTNLIAESYRARICTLGTAIERLEGILTPAHTAFLSNNACTLILTKSTITKLHEENIPITPEIREFLITVNRGCAHEIITEASSQLDNLMDPIEIYGPLYLQLPGMALKQLHQAGFPLQREIFERLCGRNGREMMTLLWIVNRLSESGLLTQENFRAATAGAGSRAGEIMARLKTLPPVFDQNAWNAIIRDIQEKEWEPCRNAAIVFGQRNRMGEPQLPPEIIGKIAGYLAPPAMPQYERAAFHLAGVESSRGINEV